MSEGRAIGAVVVVASILSLIFFLPAVVLAQGNAGKGNGLYTQFCAACHGAGGKGDGVAAAALNPKPRDLTDKAYVAGLKDQYLSEVIQKGGAAVGKAPLMPPNPQFKDGEVRDLITFIRSLAK